MLQKRFVSKAGEGKMKGRESGVAPIVAKDLAARQLGTLWEEEEDEVDARQGEDLDEETGRAASS